MMNYDDLLVDMVAQYYAAMNLRDLYKMIEATPLGL